MKKIIILLFLLFLASCSNSSENINSNSEVLPEITYSGMTVEQINVLENFLKEYEQKLRESEEKFSEEVIERALYIKKREEVQKFLLK